MTSDGRRAANAARRPGLTACSLCAGETLADTDTLPGGQLTRLRRIADDGVAQVTFSECLDECNRGDVVVVRPCALARRQGARPVWFERLVGDELTDALVEWLRSGAVGLAALPQPLESRVVDRGGAAASDEPSQAV